MTDSFEKAVFNDIRGSHVKLFGKTPEKIHVTDFEVKEVFMTVNHRNVVRGMHFQVNPAQPKILSCITGKALVNVLCLDEDSENFLSVDTFTLSGDLSTAEGNSFIHVPAKHALGYRILEDNTRMLYLAGSDFNGAGDVGIDPFDEETGIFWGENFTREDAILSDRDKQLPKLSAYLENSRGENE